MIPMRKKMFMMLPITLMVLSSQAAARNYEPYVVLGCQHKENIAHIIEMQVRKQSAQNFVLSMMATGECRYVDVGSSSTWGDDGRFIHIREGAMTVPYWALKDDKGVN